MKLAWAAALICLALSPMSASAQTETGLGEWRGALSIPQGDLHVIVRIAKASGALSGAMESPDQPGSGSIPLTVTQAGPQRLAFEVPSIQASYTGEWTESLHGWSGQWSQSGVQLPLTLRRAADAPK